MKVLKDSVKTIIISLITLSLISAAYAWTEPALNPPAGNISAPINTSSNNQAKSGSLSVGTTSIGLNDRLTARSAGNTSAYYGLRVQNNSGTDQLVVRSDGRTGIMQSSPGYALDVAGTARASTSVISPVFYDQDNALYYANPAGSSAFSGLSVSSGLSVGNGLNVYSGYVSKMKMSDMTNTFAAMDTNGNWTWTRVVSNTYATGSGNRNSGWKSVALDSNKPVLGIQISGSSDDGGVCAVNITNYFSAAATNIAYITDLDLDGIWSGNAWNNGASSFATGTWIFDKISSGRYLGAQNYGDNTAYNKPSGFTYIPPGRTLYYSQWYNDGGGGYGNTCYIDVLYGNSF